VLDDLIRPSSLEVATGWLIGEVDGCDDEDDDLSWKWLSATSPRQALEAAVLKALQRPPCVIDFSGGRDSSLVLATATHVARREGLPLPLPRSNRFPLDAASNEDEWQEMVIRHLHLKDWEIATVTGELDIVGERAQSFLLKYGLLVPERFYVNTASLELARGGSYLTGEGGDEVLLPRRARFARAAIGAPRAVARSRAARVAVARNLAPRPARFLVLLRQYSSTQICSWLKPEPARRFNIELARSMAREPISWRSYLRWHLRRRIPHTIAHNMDVIATDYDVLHLQPLLNRAFLASLARCGGVLGFETRTDAMTFLAEDLLPTAVLARPTKPGYNTAYFTDIAREFTKTWDGTGLDEELVEPEKLRSALLGPLPNAAGFALLQAAWLAKRRQDQKCNVVPADLAAGS
jgi:asparagine synthase (glutamine-hydrolysing)